MMSDTTELAVGGLRFYVNFRAVGSVPGATIRVEGPVGDGCKELLRFDDFVGAPHFHAPADGDAIDFDPANGDPMEWYLTQIGTRLGHWLTVAGYPEVLAAIDTKAIAESTGLLRDAMHECVPAGFERVPGVGLRRSPDGDAG